MAPLKADFVGISQHSGRRKNSKSLSPNAPYAPPQNLFSDSERFDIEACAKRLTYDKTDIVDFNALAETAYQSDSAGTPEYWMNVQPQQKRVKLADSPSIGPPTRQYRAPAPQTY